MLKSKLVKAISAHPLRFAFIVIATIFAYFVIIGIVVLVNLSSLSSTLDNAKTHFKAGDSVALKDDIVNISQSLETVCEQADIPPLQMLKVYPILNENIANLQDVSHFCLETTQKIADNPEIVLEILGFSSSKNYLMLFQNPAEARPFGGVPSNMMLLNVENGSNINVIGSASGHDFPFTNDPDYRTIERPDSFYEIWPLHIFRSPLSWTSYPDFATDAEVTRINWEKQFNDRVDGVMTFDPVALGYLLEAFGGSIYVDMTGDTLTSQNTSELLLNTYYLRYSNPNLPETIQLAELAHCNVTDVNCLTDAAFDATKLAILNRVQNEEIDMPKFMNAIFRAIYERRLMVNFTDPNTQSILNDNTNFGAGLRGKIQADTGNQVNLAAYFMDVEASKIDYYMDMNVTLQKKICLPENTTYFVIDQAISSRINQQEAKKLPLYIINQDVTRTDFYAIAPENAEFVGWEAIDKGSSSMLYKQGNDPDLGGRYIARSQAYNKFTQNVHRFTFKEPFLDFRTANLLTNPALNQVSVSNLWSFDCNK